MYAGSVTLLSTLPIKVEQCYMKPLPRFNFEEACGPCLLSKHFRSKYPHGGAVSRQLTVSLGAYSVSFLLGHLTQANLCVFQIILVPSLTLIHWFHFWGKKMQETFVWSRFLQKWNMQITLWLVVELLPDTYMPWLTTLWKWWDALFSLWNCELNGVVSVHQSEEQYLKSKRITWDR